MAQYKAFAPGVQVNGETVLAVVDGMGAFKQKGLIILNECGIKNPKPGLWYPQEKWLKAFDIIAQTLGSRTLYSIGLKIPGNAIFPKNTDTMSDALASIDIAYHMNHKGGEIGNYRFISTGTHSATMHCLNPYPHDFDHGIIEAVARKFTGSGARSPRVVHDDEAECRNKGGDSCTYHIYW